MRPRGGTKSFFLKDGALFRTSVVHCCSTKPCHHCVPCHHRWQRNTASFPLLPHMPAHGGSAHHGSSVQPQPMDHTLAEAVVGASLLTRLTKVGGAPPLAGACACVKTACDTRAVCLGRRSRGPFPSSRSEQAGLLKTCSYRSDSVTREMSSGIRSARCTGQGTMTLKRCTRYSAREVLEYFS